MTEMIRNCTACKASALSQSNINVSISSLSNKFNEIVCIDHSNLEDVCLMHFMALLSRFSTVHVVYTATMKDV